MSLDVYLEIPGDKASLDATESIFVRDNGQTVEISLDEWNRRYPGREPVITQRSVAGEVYTANITHNLGKMAAEAGIYDCLWRPDQNGITKANQLIKPLTDGLELLQSEAERFIALNPENGWGSYDVFVPWVARYLEACKKYPNADVSVWR